MRYFYAIALGLFLVLGAAICFGQLPPTPPTIRLELTWTDNSTNETQFIIQRSLSADESGYGDIGAAPADFTRYVDTLAPAGVKLWYRVRAVNASEQGEPSAPAVWTPAPPPTPTPTPKPAGIPKKATNAKVKAAS